jgi:hypothetical protein
MIATINSDVATGRRMNGLEGFIEERMKAEGVEQRQKAEGRRQNRSRERVSSPCARYASSGISFSFCLLPSAF